MVSAVEPDADEAIVLELTGHTTTADLEPIRDNVRRYCQINMSFGALSAPKDMSASEGPITSLVQHVWASGNGVSSPSSEDPHIRPEISAGLSRARFPAFDRDASIRTCWLTTAAITGVAAAAPTLKLRLVEALSQLQRAALPCDPKAVVVSFDNPGLLDVLRREGVITARKPGTEERFDGSEKARIVAAIRDAFEYIRAGDATLHDLIVSVTSTIVCVKRLGSSGSVSSLVSVIWLNPTDAWTIVDYAENIVHEFIHTSIFLDDLVHGVFVQPHNYTPPDSLVTSAILRYPRGFNISFHSFYVAAGLTIFLRAVSQYERAAQIAAGLETTLPQLRRLVSSHLTPYAQARYSLVSPSPP